MLAVDTNIVVRYIARDDESQSKRARAIVDGDVVFVSPTVILETEWVLRSVYEFSPAEIRRSLVAFLGMANVRVGDDEAVRRAFDLMESGLDLADALHLAQAGECEAFVTFDKRLVKRARALDGLAVRIV